MAHGNNQMNPFVFFGIKFFLSEIYKGNYFRKTDSTFK